MNARVEIAKRAREYEKTTPRPFLRWAGSKRSLIHKFVDVIPTTYNRYYEPFLGSGSLFFLLQPRTAFLSDLCSDLIDTYAALRDNPIAIRRYLSPLTPTKECYYNVRNNRSNGRFRYAAEFIYLNHTCWNGLYRVNLSGQFNVPFGAPKPNQKPDIANLMACSSSLQAKSIRLRCCDFEAATASCKRDDLVFFDPPYVTSHNNNGFIDYNHKLFSWDDQIRLRDHAVKLANLGAKVIITNADHPEVKILYQDFESVMINRNSTLASKSSARKMTSEQVFFSY